MAKRNRTSFQKRDRERKKAEKAHRRRERREGRADSASEGSDAIVVENVEQAIPAPDEGPTPALEQPMDEEPRPDAV